MLEPVQVWAVELSAGSTAERAGTLALEPEALRFEPSEPGRTISLPLAEIVRVRRVRGSPVLMVVARRGAEEVRTAFYFVRPPPLPGAASEEGPRLAIPLPGSPRRKARRRNVGYLGLMNREYKGLLVAWERAVREAAAAARATGA
jgi:hypothetical protein